MGTPRMRSVQERNKMTTSTPLRGKHGWRAGRSDWIFLGRHLMLLVFVHVCLHGSVLGQAERLCTARRRDTTLIVCRKQTTLGIECHYRLPYLPDDGTLKALFQGNVATNVTKAEEQQRVMSLFDSFTDLFITNLSETAALRELKRAKLTKMIVTFSEAMLSADSNISLITPAGSDDGNINSSTATNNTAAKRSASNFLERMERGACLLASLLPVGQQQSVETDSMILQVAHVDTKQNHSVKFYTSSAHTEVSMPQVTSPVLVDISQFKHLEQVLDADSQQDDKDTVVNTHIISVAVRLETRKSVEPAPDVAFQLKHLTYTSDSNQRCVFLNASSLSWSADGCRVVSSNLSHTSCVCRHQSSFAILMQVAAVVDASSLAVHDTALTYITYVGCSLSILGLIFSLTTFLTFRILKSDRNTIHIHLVATLGLAQLLFLAGVDQTGNKVACGVIAGLLHYLWMSVFSWMLMEGLQIYLKLVVVFETSRSLMPVYLAVGYGLPALIVGVSAGVYSQGYGTEANCWLSTERGFIWSFLGPAMFIVAVNIAMLGVAINVMCRHFRSPSRKDMSTVDKMKSWIKGSVMLAMLLGVAWVFGVMNQGGERTLVFAYLFVFLNTLQGVFIFIFHCVLNDKVRKEYRRVLRKSTWMPDCFRSSLFRLVASKVDISSPTTATAKQKGTISQFVSTSEHSKSTTAPSCRPLAPVAVIKEEDSSALATSDKSSQALYDNGVYVGTAKTPDTARDTAVTGVEQEVDVAPTSDVISDDDVNIVAPDAHGSETQVGTSRLSTASSSSDPCRDLTSPELEAAITRAVFTDHSLHNLTTPESEAALPHAIFIPHTHE